MRLIPTCRHTSELLSQAQDRTLARKWLGAQQFKYRLSPERARDLIVPILVMVGTIFAGLYITGREVILEEAPGLIPSFGDAMMRGSGSTSSRCVIRTRCANFVFDDGIVYSVAAEMRVLYHLERVYKIPRSTRSNQP